MANNIGRNAMPAWMKYPSIAQAETVAAAKELVKLLEKNGVFLRTLGAPGSMRYRAYDALWRPLGTGTIEELVADLHLSSSPISPDPH